jgi:hypothetical protein
LSGEVLESGAAFGLEKRGLFVGLVESGKRFGCETAVLPDGIAGRQTPPGDGGLGNVKKLE